MNQQPAKPRVGMRTINATSKNASKDSPRQQAILDLEPTTHPVPRYGEREVRTPATMPNSAIYAD